MKLNKIALLALSLSAFSAPAMAQIQQGIDGASSELFLSAFDAEAQVSYTLDLGIFMEDFLPDSVKAGSKHSFDLSADDNWNQFLGLATASKVRWNVGAYNKLENRALTTSAEAVEKVATQTNAGLKQFGIVNNYVASVNAQEALNAGQMEFTPVEVNASLFRISEGPADQVYAANCVGEKWCGKAAFNVTGALGQDQSFYYLTTSGPSGIKKANYDLFDNEFGVAYWNLSETGVLTYTPAVPEPETYAMIAGGLAAVAIARRRKKA